jgi:hypothetical protein
VAGKGAAATHWREELAAGRTEGGVATCCRPAAASRLTPGGKEQRRGGARRHRTWWNLRGLQSLLTAAAAAPGFAEEGDASLRGAGARAVLNHAEGIWYLHLNRETGSGIRTQMVRLGQLFSALAFGSIPGVQSFPNTPKRV